MLTRHSYIIAGNGGNGIRCHSGSPLITNNTIVANGAAEGAGIYCDSASPTITNNIIAFNWSGIYQSSTGSASVLSNNCVFGNKKYDYSGLSAGGGDISGDPQFAGLNYGNLHLQTGSPCVDSGYDGAVSAGAADTDGQPRIQGDHVDIGADECYGETWTVSPVAVRVAPTGDDDNDGLTWATAKKTVQRAIDDVSLLNGEVWVAAGVYKERITLRAFSYLYGGFSGNETDKTQRDPKLNETTLDGESAGHVVVCDSGHTCTAIDGFTISNGSSDEGGGVFCCYSSPTVTNNKISGNYTSSVGAAVYCYAGSAILKGNDIRENRGQTISYRRSAESIIANNTMTRNDTNAHSVLECSETPAVIANNVIAGNGGSAILCASCSPSVTGNTIVGNTAADGAGVFCNAASPVISNNIIALNSSGVHKYDEYGSPVLVNNCVYGNAAYNYSGMSAGTADISLDPQFVSAAYGDFHLKSGSPCVDKGDDSTVLAESLDMDRQVRTRGAHVDIGADESYGEAWTISPRIVRVSPAGDDANDGSSWSIAKKTVQAAIDTVSSQGGDVWVKAGTYLERITLPSYVYVYGGFSDSETDVAQRDWRTNQTAIDSAGMGTVVTCSSGYYCSAIDGFTLQGWGIVCWCASPIIANNTFVGWSRSAILCNTSSPVIRGNSICNVAPFIKDGAIRCLGSSAPTIAGNLIAGNGGVAISCESSAPKIINNTVVGNLPPSGSGVISPGASSPLICNNIVAFNSSGIYGSVGTILRNNCVFGNTAYNYSGITAGTGDISADPLIVNRAGGNYHITALSPCKDTGLNTTPGLTATDIDGQPRIYGATVDIGADECWPVSSITASRAGWNDTEAELTSAIVTAAFIDFLYVETPDRITGIRVDKAAHGLTEGIKADVRGLVKTNGNGERYIQATSAAQSAPPDNTGSVEPLGLNIGLIGGGNWLYDPVTGAGQVCVKAWQWTKQPDGKYAKEFRGMSGLNNLGMLIQVFGKVTPIDSGSFWLSDGSADRLKVIVPSGVITPGDGSYVGVVGISSCERPGADMTRLLRVRKQADITVLRDP